MAVPLLVMYYPKTLSLPRDMHDGCKTHSELMGLVERKWNPYGRVPCKDGWLVWSAENNFSWEGTTSSLESKKKKFQNRS